MEGSTETIVTPKKTRKTRSTSANEDVVENKTNYEPESVIPNGKGKTNGEESGEDESRPKTEVKSNKIIKISKSTKTSVKDTAKTTASPNKNKPDKRPEESSPSSSLLSEDFCGFEEFTESDEQLKNKRALQRLLDSLEDVEEKEKKTEDESEEEAMTAEDADAADSDSNQMEIDEGNSLADSVEFSDKNAKKVKDSDREVMETDSVKNVEGSPEKPEGDAKPAEEPTTELAAAESGDQLKVEYCGTCNLVVDDAEEGICCDGKCERWFHLQCSGLTQAEYDELSHDENAKWACNRCSGKPPPEIKPGAKPLLTVRKDLTAVSTPSPKRKITTKEDKRPRVDISNPIFLKPFDYGWKRELVFRSTSDSATKKQGDVYYYTPKGKKLRSLREIGEHLIGTDLSIDNFTFWKDALGCDPEKEIIRDAKIKLNKDKDSNASPVPTVKKPAPPKTPKTPKTTPKLTATVTPLDSASGLPVVAKVSASVTPRVVLKAGKTGSLNTGPKFKATPNKTNTPGQPNKIVINKDGEKAAGDHQSSEDKLLQDSLTVLEENSQINEINGSNGFDHAEIREEDDEVTPRKKTFRRCGLLANRVLTRNNVRKKMHKHDSASSSGGSEEESTTPEKRSCQMSQFDVMKAAGLKPRGNNSSQTESRISSSSSVSMFKGHPIPQLMHGGINLSHSDKKRPRSPEMQFRPSDPSSYGCQTNALPLCRPVVSNIPGLLSSYQPAFETVYIVDTSSEDPSQSSSPERPIVKSLNSKPSKSPHSVQWTQDCSIKVLSVESLKTTCEFSNETHLVASSPKQSISPNNKRHCATIRCIEENNTPQSSRLLTKDKCETFSDKNLTTDIIVIDEYRSENSLPPVLVKEKYWSEKQTESQNQSLRCLKNNLSPPALSHPAPLSNTDPTTDSIPVITIDSSESVTSSQTSSTETASTESSESEKKKKPDSDDDMEMGMLPPTWDPVQKPKENKIRQMDVCSIRCLPAMGLIPTLQCIVCLCLYHPECVGLGETGQTTIHNYKCKNCQLEKPKPAAGNNQKSAQLLPPPPPLTPALSSINTSTVPMSHMMVPAKNSLQRIMDNKLNRNVEGPRNRTPVTKSTSIVGGVTTWLPPSSTIQLRSPTLATKSSPSQKALLPSTTSHDPPSGQPVQSVLTTGTHRFIVVPKHNVLSVSPATTSSTQVSDSVSTQVTTTTSDASSGVATQAYGPGGPILPKPQVSTPAFILGSPTTTTSGFQSPPGVLLVPYIAPQTSPTQKEGQQPQYIVVNGPSGLQPGNFIIGNIPQQQQLKLASVPTSQPADLPTLTPVKRALEEAEGPPPAKQARLSSAPAPAPNMELLMSQACGMYDCLLQVFQYLKVQEVLRASRVCRMWRDLALHKSLWEVVRMKNSQVKDWEGFAATLRRTGTRHLDLRKMLMPDKQEALRAVWADCIKALSKVNTLVKLDMCRCTGGWLEQIIAVCPQIEYISAGAIKSSSLNLTSLKNCQNLTELRLKSLSGMEVNNIDVLENLTKLKNVSLTSVKNMTKVLEVVPKLTNLEVLELGEMTNLSNEAVTEAFSKLTKLRRLRLEKGGEGCPTDIILETISQLPSLVQLELINFDVKAGFDEALGRCTNIKVLLIIPTYVTQSATTNHLVIEGVSKLSKSLVHFVWGLTLELLRVTDLFIDQWEMNKNTGPKSPNQAPKKSAGDSIPILKPSTKDGKKVKEGAVTQVDVLQLPKLHKVLTTLLPNTRIIILKVPFSATWRQTISGSTQ